LIQRRRGWLSKKSGEEGVRLWLTRGNREINGAKKKSSGGRSGWESGPSCGCIEQEKKLGREKPGGLFYTTAVREERFGKERHLGV